MVTSQLPCIIVYDRKIGYSLARPGLKLVLGLILGVEGRGKSLGSKDPAGSLFVSYVRIC